MQAQVPHGTRGLPGSRPRTRRSPGGAPCLKQQGRNCATIQLPALLVCHHNLRPSKFHRADNVSRPGRKPRPPRQPRTDADNPKQTEEDRRDIRQVRLDGQDTTGHMDRLYMRKCVRTFLHGVAIANRVLLKHPTSRREISLRSPGTTGRGSSEEDPQVRFLLRPPPAAGKPEVTQ